MKTWYSSLTAFSPQLGLRSPLIRLLLVLYVGSDCLRIPVFGNFHTYICSCKFLLPLDFVGSLFVHVFGCRAKFDDSIIVPHVEQLFMFPAYVTLAFIDMVFRFKLSFKCSLVSLAWECFLGSDMLFHESSSYEFLGRRYSSILLVIFSCLTHSCPRELLGGPFLISNL